jgi:glycosyltransferase involved in cell wall biosynthesis
MGPKQQPWWDNTIEPLLAKSKMINRLFILENVPYEMISSYTHGAAIGIIIYDDSVLNNIFCEPGKLSDFVHAGVPVIAPAFPSIKPVVEGNSLGVTFSDYSTEGIANAINDGLSLPALHFKNSFQSASKLMSWEAQWQKLKKALLG